MKFHLVLLLILTSAAAWADPTPPSWDENRLAGFAEHNDEGKVEDRERLKGIERYKERVRRDNQARLRALEEHKKEIKAQSPQEFGPEWREDQNKKLKVVKEHELSREKYIDMKARMLARKNSNLHLVTPDKELGLNFNLPRFDISKRALYGAKPLGQIPKEGAFGNTGRGGGGGGTSFPNAPPFDANSNGQVDNGFFPPPVVGDGEENAPGINDFGIPPPPSPSFEDGEFPQPPVPEEFAPPPPPMGFPAPYGP